jgi:hypothetical protein
MPERESADPPPESASLPRIVEAPWVLLGAGAIGLAVLTWTGSQIARLARLSAAQGVCGTQETFLLFVGLGTGAIAALMLGIAVPRALRARSRRRAAVSVLVGLATAWALLLVRLLSA